MKTSNEIKIIFDLDQMWVFYPRLVEYDKEHALGGQIPYQLNNNISYVDVVNQYELAGAQQKAGTIDKALLDEWIQKRDDFLQINQIFENAYQIQEKINP